MGSTSIRETRWVRFSPRLIPFWSTLPIGCAERREYQLRPDEFVVGDRSAMVHELLTGKVGMVNTSKPLDVNLNVQNYSLSSASIPNGSEISLDLAVSSEGKYVTLNAYCGNFMIEGNFTFTYSPNSGNHDFNSVVIIRNTGSLPGVYFLTLAARTNSLAVSKIVEIKVP